MKLAVQTEHAMPQLSLTECAIDLDVGDVRWQDGRVFRLTTREVALLRYLSTRIGEDVSRDELHAEVWGHGVHTISRAAADTVRRLRPKIEVVPTQPRHLLTVHGEGYRLLGTPTESKPIYRAHELPTERTPLIGREDVVASALEALEAGRLVTLVGPGGVGKTRLALRIAHAHSAESFVDASEARSLDALRDQIATHLHLKEPRDVSELAQRMAPVTGLVVLDNLEQVAEPAAEILAAWLQRPGTGRILVTSRARLGVRGEQVIHVSPLHTEDGVQLLQQHLSLFGAAAVDQEKLLALHQTVEGLPLALELAAARVARLGLDRVVERLNEAPANLKAFRRTGPERHRSVRSTVEWSWELLDPVEQMVLSHAAVFRGGVSIRALEAALEGLMPADRDVDECVAALVEHALLRPERPGRVRLYVSVREVAESHLGNRADALRRHTRGVLACCEVAWKQHHHPLTSGSLTLMEAEQENLLRVLEQVRGQEFDAWCRTVLYLSPLWLRDGMARRAVEEITAVMEAPGSNTYEAHLLKVLCHPLHIMGRREEAWDALCRAEAGLRAHTDRGARVYCLVGLAREACWTSNFEEMEAHLSELDEIARLDPDFIAVPLVARARCHQARGQHAETLALVEQLWTHTLSPRSRLIVETIEVKALLESGSEVDTADRFRFIADQYEQRGEVYVQAIILSLQARAEAAAGQTDAAAKCYTQAEAIYLRAGAKDSAAGVKRERLSLASSQDPSSP